MVALSRNGRKKEARAAYETATKLYLERLRREETPRPIGDVEGLSAVLWPGSVATFWFSYLLEHGSKQEVDDLEKRLRDAWQRTGKNPDDVVVARASAEFASRRYSAAAKSLEFCLRKKLWNEIATEAIITGGLARSLRALGRRQDAIKWYRRAIPLSDVDPALLSEFLCCIVEEQGVDGLSRELPTYEQTWKRLDVRLNATLSCFSAWAALANHDEKEAFEKFILAIPYVLLASQQAVFSGEEGIVCGVIHHVISEKLEASKHVAGATEFLKSFPAERVKAMKKVFSLPE
jgi:tetratricopeptide (TPR) repeat protein